MKRLSNTHWWRRIDKKAAVLGGLIIIAGIAVSLGAQQLRAVDYQGQRLITVYDRGVTLSFVSEAKTLGEALREQDFQFDDRDAVEPSRSEELIAPEYHVNIYRARPVTVIDGAVRVKTVSPYQTPEAIAKDAGFELAPEDTARIHQSNDVLYDGAGLQLVIDRSVPVSIDLFGRQVEVRTQARTVGAMLEEKKIRITERDRVSVATSTPITAGMKFRVWREGVQTVSVDQPVPFTSEIVYDADRPLGYRVVQQTGVAGIRTITSQIEIRDGVEVSRTELARIDTKAPMKQIEVIGLRNDGGGLTKSKGAQYFTDSKGISHRETYYDLNMSVVMKSCGQGGYYTVRPDGAKVDGQGYVIIAANYGNYPKCSVVETSLGPGKVYDTGGFAARHPHGFDLATDWSRGDGI